MELLERVVGEDGGTGSVGDLQEEAVAPTDRAGRGRDDRACELGLLVLLALGVIDSVPERCVDNDDHIVARVLVAKCAHRAVQLSQARLRSALGGQVGPVDYHSP